MLATTHVFWITSRAAGSVALLLSSVAVCAGLLMGGRLVSARKYDLRPIHEALSLATLVALAVHALALLGDSYFKPSLADLTIPFVSGTSEPWMSIGIVSGWLLVALGLSYYARTRIGVARWRKLHRLTAIAWLGGLVHALGQGTDADTAWFIAATALVTVPALVLLVVRHLRSSDARSPRNVPVPGR
jgi:sulfoxide reductase heme-binding subunit YedZ